MKNQLYLYFAPIVGKIIKNNESKAFQNKILSALHQNQQMTY
jgi:hypothetical protein